MTRFDEDPKGNSSVGIAKCPECAGRALVWAGFLMRAECLGDNRSPYTQEKCVWKGIVGPVPVVYHETHELPQEQLDAPASSENKAIDPPEAR